MYAKLENGNLIPAPRKIIIEKDGKPFTVFNPSGSTLSESGYKPVEYGAVPQDAPNGYTTSYVDTDTCIKVIYTARPIDADYIRARREHECFPIVNRGQLWYSFLSDKEFEEFARWYQEWLIAPETLTIPKMPDWLVNKI